MIEYRDTKTGPWKQSQFPWDIEDVAWLNGILGWAMYRVIGPTR